VQTRHPEWLRDKKVRIIAQYGREPLPEIPHVPLIFDQAKNREERQALNLLLARQQMAKPYVAPPHLAARRTDELRTAFMETLSDPAFRQEAKRLKIELHSMTGQDVQKLVGELYSTPPAIVTKVKNILSQKVQ
jgi:hypothetical protein